MICGLERPALRVLVALLLIWPQPLVPAVIVVDGQTDDPPGTCDLVEAIDNANDDAQTHADCVGGDPGADEIQLATDVFLNSVNHDSSGPNGLPAITSEITIEGGGYTIERAGMDDLRILLVDAAGDLTLNDVTVSNGRVDLNAVSVGAGILNHGTLALTHSTVTGNSTISSAAFAYGGGIMNIGTATITDSTISNNLVYVSAGNNPLASGGGIANGYFPYTGTLTITNSTLSGNTAQAVGTNQGGAYGGGAYFYRGTSDVINSTFSGNLATADSDDSIAAGGGLTVAYSATTLTHTTIADNEVIAIGPLAFEAAGGLDGTLAPPAAVQIVGSILGYHPDGNCFSIEAGTDLGDNLADDLTCGSIPDTLTGLSPALADNLGPTLTHRLLDGSSAIDNAGDCGLASDQRGAARGDGFCDSGAFEAGVCIAPDGDTILLELDTVVGIELFEVCTTITAENGYMVAGPDGDLTLRAGSSVVLGDGFSVAIGGRLTIENDPGLQKPASRAPFPLQK